MAFPHCASLHLKSGLFSLILLSLLSHIFESHSGQASGGPSFRGGLDDVEEEEGAAGFAFLVDFFGESGGVIPGPTAPVFTGLGGNPLAELPSSSSDGQASAAWAL
tara:strand:+ start:480 stop:797 length:318 start_codon:yes stop_codon:yes gene_type:complete